MVLTSQFLAFSSRIGPYVAPDHGLEIVKVFTLRIFYAGPRRGAIRRGRICPSMCVVVRIVGKMTGFLVRRVSAPVMLRGF